MNKKLFAIVTFAIFALVGCLEYQEKVKLNKDGSGTISIRFELDENYVKQMAELAKMTEKMTGEKTEPQRMFATRDEVESFIAQSKSAVKLLEYESNESNSMVDASFSFGSVNEMDIASASVFAMDEDGDSTMYSEADSAQMSHDDELPSNTSFVKQADGTWLFSRIMDTDSEMGGAFGDDAGPSGEEYPGDEEQNDEYADEEEYVDESGDSEEGEADAYLEGLGLGDDLGSVVQGLEQVMADTTNPVVVISITFPGKVIESNAKSIDGATATWKFTIAQFAEIMTPMTAKVSD